MDLLNPANPASPLNPLNMHIVIHNKDFVIVDQNTSNPEEQSVRDAIELSFIIIFILAIIVAIVKAAGIRED